jgi:[ribosomal protein S5]-alanine N-acetyltransferase
MKIHIETARLIMREVSEIDAQGFFELDSDPEVHRYLGNNPVKTIEESENVIRRIQKQYEENGIGRWAVVDKETGAFMGWSGLKWETSSKDGARYYDLGYRLIRKYWGRGIATETAIESLKYGFEKMKLKEIFAAAHVENIASNRILRKTGFQFLETIEAFGAEHNWYRISEYRSDSLK